MEEVGIRRLTGFGVMPGSLLSSSRDSSQMDKKAWLKTAWLRERMKEVQKDFRSARLRLTTALGALNS